MRNAINTKLTSITVADTVRRFEAAVDGKLLLLLALMWWRPAGSAVMAVSCRFDLFNLNLNKRRGK